MRRIGHIDNISQANLFSDYLYANSMENEVEGDASDGWDIWVHDEESLAGAKKALAEFLADPEDSRYRSATQAAEELRRKTTEEEFEFQKKVYDRKRIMRHSLWSSSPVTLALIIISVAVTLFAGLGSGSKLTQWLTISRYSIADGVLLFDKGLPEIMNQGQLWRLITPIFIHQSILVQFGLLHILFNMLWLRELGLMLERAQGKIGLIIKVLIIAALSNLGQYVLGGPAFGGMSGVVFGLLGYCWMRGRLDLTSGLYVHSQTIFMMSIWFLLCLFGLMGPIANGAHGVGLIVGTTWGYLSAYRVNSRS